LKKTKKNKLIQIKDIYWLGKMLKFQNMPIKIKPLNLTKLKKYSWYAQTEEISKKIAVNQKLTKTK
jgi:hypothetical protein